MYEEAARRKVLHVIARLLFNVNDFWEVYGFVGGASVNVGGVAENCNRKTSSFTTAIIKFLRSNVWCFEVFLLFRQFLRSAPQIWEILITTLFQARMKRYDIKTLANASLFIFNGRFVYQQMFSTIRASNKAFNEHFHLVDVNVQLRRWKEKSSK